MTMDKMHLIIIPRKSVKNIFFEIKTGRISASHAASGFGPEKCSKRAVFPNVNYTVFFIPYFGDHVNHVLF